MSWATQHIKHLLDGQTVSFRPRGHSMTGIISSGQLVTVAPVTASTPIRKGDVVLCKVGGKQFLHLVKACQGNRFQIGNNRGRINGWTSRNTIYGVLTSVAE